MILLDRARSAGAKHLHQTSEWVPKINAANASPLQAIAPSGGYLIASPYIFYIG
jgi:hypothetical protein